MMLQLLLILLTSQPSLSLVVVTVAAPWLLLLLSDVNIATPPEEEEGAWPAGPTLHQDNILPDIQDSLAGGLVLWVEYWCVRTVLTVDRWVVGQWEGGLDTKVRLTITKVTRVILIGNTINYITQHHLSNPVYYQHRPILRTEVEIL